MKLCRLKISTFIWIGVFCFWACNEKISKNEYLGELPVISGEYKEQINELERKAETAVEINKAYRYSVEAEKLEQTAQLEIKKLWDAMKHPVRVPFIQTDCSDEYKIKQIRIIGASYNYLRIEAEAVVNTEASQYVAYLRGIDNMGKEIKGWGVLFFVSDSTSGHKVIFKGRYNNIEKLLKLKQFKLCSEDYYNENHNN